MMKPTDEQAEIVAGFGRGSSMVIEAGAGTGKTSTIELIGRSSSQRMLYLAYNRAIADEAKHRMPRNVTSSTAHSLAYRAIGSQYRHRLNSPRMPARDIAKALGLTRIVLDGDSDCPPRELEATNVARIVMATIEKFCRSHIREIDGRHVPPVEGLSYQQHKWLRERVVPPARQAWSDIVSEDGRLPFSHDCHLKIWALSRPRLPYDVILFDEAQDADPLIASIVMAQERAQRVLVGDRNQALYAWRGAVDAMSTFEADERHALSQSFRFGPAIAAEANVWLKLLGATLRIKGTPTIDSRVELEPPHGSRRTIVCRTNAGAMGEAFAAQSEGLTPAIVGGTKSIEAMARAAIQLKATGTTTHPELMAFSSWADVEEYVDKDPSGSDLAVFVRMVNQSGAEDVLQCCASMGDERDADVIISTGHKAKGREWPAVEIGIDYASMGDRHDAEGRVLVSRASAMLAYVSVTRAKSVLVPTGLFWSGSEDMAIVDD